MSWFTKLIRALFLVKEIVSKEGVVHFRRYRLLSTPWFNLYLHQILKSDEDRHFHDHPWSFRSFIISGNYEECWRCPPSFEATHYRRYREYDLVRHPAEDAHSLTLVTPEVWTLVLTSGRARVWGYRLDDGNWTDFVSYRKMKSDKLL